MSSTPRAPPAPPLPLQPPPLPYQPTPVALAPIQGSPLFPPAHQPSSPECFAAYDCNGSKVYCEFNKCTCNWALQLGGEDCSKLTGQSILPFVLRILAVMLYAWVLAYAVAVVRGLPPVIQHLTPAERRSACCMPSRAGCTLVWGLFGVLLLLFGESVVVIDMLGGNFDKFAIDPVFYFSQGIGSCFCVLAGLNLSMCWIEVGLSEDASAHHVPHMLRKLRLVRRLVWLCEATTALSTALLLPLGLFVTRTFYDLFSAVIALVSVAILVSFQIGAAKLGGFMLRSGSSLRLLANPSAKRTSDSIARLSASHCEYYTRVWTSAHLISFGMATLVVGVCGMAAGRALRVLPLHAVAVWLMHASAAGATWTLCSFVDFSHRNETSKVLHRAIKAVRMQIPLHSLRGGKSGNQAKGKLPTVYEGESSNSITEIVVCNHDGGDEQRRLHVAACSTYI